MSQIDIFRLYNCSALLVKYHSVMKLFTPGPFRMRRGWSEECEVHPGRGHGCPILTNRSLEGESTDRGKIDRSRTGRRLYLVFPHNGFSFHFIATIDLFVYFFYKILMVRSWSDSGCSESFFFPFSNDVVFQGMTTHSTNLASAARGTTTSAHRVTPTGEIIFLQSFTTSRRGRGTTRRRSGTSRERALMGAHLQSKTPVSLCPQQMSVRKTPIIHMILTPPSSHLNIYLDIRCFKTLTKCSL